MWHRNLVWKNCWLLVMQELILHADTVKQVRLEGPGQGISASNRSRGIVKWRKDWEVFGNLSAMFTSIQAGFVSKETRGMRLENNFARSFGRHLSPRAMAAVFVGTS